MKARERTNEKKTRREKKHILLWDKKHRTSQKAAVTHLLRQKLIPDFVIWLSRFFFSLVEFVKKKVKLISLDAVFFLSSKTTVKRGECNVNREKLRIETGIYIFFSEYTNEFIGFTLPLVKFFFHFLCCFQLITNENSFSFVDFRRAFFSCVQPKYYSPSNLSRAYLITTFPYRKLFHRSASD